MEEVKRFLNSAGIEPRDVPLALAIHEGLGVGVLFSAWGLCWAVRPSQSLLRVLQIQRLPQWRKAQEKAETSKLVDYVKRSKLLSNKRGAELTIAFGESYFLRKLCMPVLVPLKLWMTYRLVTWRTSRSELGVIKSEKESKVS